MLIQPYYRRSKADKKRRLSIEMQGAEFNRWLEDNPGWTALPAAIDDGKSAFDERPERRPRFKELMDAARAKRFDGIWVYMYDRFSRKLALSAPFLEELDRLGIRVISATEPEDWESRAQASLDAEKFSRRLSVRMQGVKRFDASNGRWVGAVPYGYDRVNGYLVPNADAATVALIFDLYVTNRYSIMDVVDELRARGMQRSSPYHYDGEPYNFGGQSIRQILTNRVYIGEVRCRKLSVPDAHPAIISTDVWNAAQEIRARRALHKGRLTVQAAAKGILTGIVRCAVCGNAMWHNTTGQGSRSYKCARNIRYHDCDNPLGYVADVDRYVLHILGRLKLPEDWQREILALLDTSTKAPAHDAAQIERELRTLRAQAIDGLVSIEEFKRREIVLRAKLAAQPPAAVPDLERAARLLQNFSTLVANATADEQRALVSTIFSTVWLRGSVVEAWAPREVYRPLFVALYGLTIKRETRGARPSPTPSPFYPALWADFQQPLVAGGAL